MASYNFVSDCQQSASGKRESPQRTLTVRGTRNERSHVATAQHGLSWEGSERLDSTIGVQKALILFGVVVSTSQDDTGRDALRDHRIHK